MSSFTPGPWRLAGGMNGESGYIASPNGYVPIRTPFVKGAHADQFGGASEEALANARLCAAAPDLLDAVEVILNGDVSWLTPRQLSLLRDVASKAREGI